MPRPEYSPCSPCHFKRVSLPVMFSGRFTPLTMGPLLGPGLSSETSFFKWPQQWSWKVSLDAANNLRRRFLYLLQVYLIPVNVLTDVIFICETKYCEDTRDSAPCCFFILHDPWNHVGLSKCLINWIFFFCRL